MHNPQYARTIWNRLRDSRPLGRVLPRGTPKDTSRAKDDAEQLGDELVDEYIRSCRRQRVGGARENHHDYEGEITMKLNVGVSRKVGQPDYGSRGASANIELELDTTEDQDTHALHDRMRQLFTVARDAVAEELGLSTQPSNTGGGQPPATNGNGRAVRPATEAQVRAINAICSRLGLDPHAEAHQRLGCGIQELTLPQASSLIDALKGLQNGQDGH